MLGVKRHGDAFLRTHNSLGCVIPAHHPTRTLIQRACAADPQEAKRATGSGASGAAAGTALMASAAGGVSPGGPVAPATQGTTPSGKHTAPSDVAKLLATQPVDPMLTLEQLKAEVQRALRNMEAEYLKLRAAHSKAAESMVAFNEFYTSIEASMQKITLELGEAHPVTKSFRANAGAVKNVAEHERQPLAIACHIYDTVLARAPACSSHIQSLFRSVSAGVVVTPEALHLELAPPCQHVRHKAL